MPWLVGLLLVAAVLAVYGRWIEPRRFELTRLALDLPGWPDDLDGFTILHLSDLHTRGWGPVEHYLQALPEQVGTVDLLAVTGDFAESVPAIEPCLEALRPIRARYGRYVALGNNDLAPAALCRALAERLTAEGFTILRDTCVRIPAGGGLWLGGLLFRFARIVRLLSYPVERLFAGADDERPRVLLAHSPDARHEAAEHGVVLMLSGHTHGGQVCLPGGVPVHTNLYRHGRWRNLKGLRRLGGLTYYVSRGLGLSPPEFRTFCRPEAVLLTLHPASQQNGNLAADAQMR